MTTTQRWTLVAAVLGSGIVFLDGSVVNVALPTIGEELPAHIIGVLEGQTYVVNGYLAVLAALLILGGALADYYGRRRIFAIGLVGFGGTSVLCGLALNFEMLVGARLLQGAAGALLVPGSLSIITAAFDGVARTRAFGIWASATSALTLGGPVVGGLLVDSLSWRWAFLINVPLVALALYATLRHMEESRDPTATGRFDWLGAAVGAIAVGGLTFGLIRGEQTDWQDPLAFGSLVVGAIALVAFPILMLRRRHPLVPLGLFRRRAFAVINISTFLIYGALYVYSLFLGLLLQGVLGYTALAAGMVGLPTSILLVLLSTRVGTIAGRRGPRPFLVAGPLLMAAGLLWISRIPATSQPWLAMPSDPASLIPPPSTLTDVLPASILFGLGISLVVAPLTSTLMGSIPTRNAGIGSAINNALARVGSPLVGALVFIVVAGTFYATLGGLLGVDPSSAVVQDTFVPLNPPTRPVTPAELTASKEASIAAFRLAMILLAGLLAAGAAVNQLGLRGRERPAEATRISSEAATG